MTQSIRYIIVAIIASFSLLFIASLVPATVHGQSIKKHVKCGAEIDFNASNGCPAPAGTESAGTSLNKLVTNIINILSVIVGVVAVIMIIIGGFKYITSGGDSNNTASAKNTIIYAIVGLIIVALAQVIVRFVLAALD
jgi:hypothetical protein